MENGSIIKAAAELIRERAPSDDRPRVWAPEGWQELDLEYPTGQLVIRLRPVGDAEADAEVFSYGNLIAAERLRKYRTADRLAELVEDVLRQAIT